MDKRNGIYMGTYFSALDVFEDDDLYTKSHESKQDIEKGRIFCLQLLRLAQLNKNNYAGINSADV